jgi:hypothetical protein
MSIVEDSYPPLCGPEAYKEEDTRNIIALSAEG